ncbi:calcitonin gene-related peptide type 1 receptor-like [Elysia marginata]|uniref:Calcitonin gene-related peptide type 1 receptor-like n=1 Tax=Elysia marginata TaxID=1093978 RepID=A0AAV4J2K7_9GAST|nr:calcitonin gene-related peptide type 1 receptor-like [Elysia marginata]
MSKAGPGVTTATVLKILQNLQLRCDRITVHKNLFISFACCALAWILYYSLVVLHGDVILDNPRSESEFITNPVMTEESVSIEEKAAVQNRQSTTRNEKTNGVRSALAEGGFGHTATRPPSASVVGSDSEHGVELVIRTATSYPSPGDSNKVVLASAELIGSRINL